METAAFDFSKAAAWGVTIFLFVRRLFSFAVVRQKSGEGIGSVLTPVCVIVFLA